MMESRNPATGELIQTYQEHTPAEWEVIIQKADQAQKSWKEVPLRERRDYFQKLSTLLNQEVQDLARLMTLEMGKPIQQARAEVEKCAWVCAFYADKGEAFLKDQEIKTEASHSFITFQPLGLIYAIMPWNFPFWQVFRCAVPAITAGNGVILKHASNVSGCALAIEALFQRAGFPENLFRTLLIRGAKALDVIDHPLIRGVTLTGSTPAGREVAARAGRNLKKTVLELGGSDPYIILEDADLSMAVQACARGRLQNTGQSCIAAKRLIPVKAIRKAFEEALLERLKQAKVGDPLDPETEVGPLAREDLREELHQQVQESIHMGARCLLGGKLPEGPGYFYPVTFLTDPPPHSPAWQEELFGPVAVLREAQDKEDAITLANETLFGLGSGIFTKDVALGMTIAKKRLETGNAFVNAFVRSDPRLPFGGIKASGYGRELSHFGIWEFVNIKTVYVA